MRKVRFGKTGGRIRARILGITSSQGPSAWEGSQRGERYAEPKSRSGATAVDAPAMTKFLMKSRREFICLDGYTRKALANQSPEKPQVGNTNVKFGPSMQDSRQTVAIADWEPSRSLPVLSNFALFVLLFC